jgi:hypothetical protein
MPENIQEEVAPKIKQVIYLAGDKNCIVSFLPIAFAMGVKQVVHLQKLPEELLQIKAKPRRLDCMPGFKLSPAAKAKAKGNGIHVFYWTKAKWDHMVESYNAKLEKATA